MALSSAQKRYLRGLAHALNPVVMVAGRGLAPSVLKEVEIALLSHELIKVRISAEDREAKQALIAELVSASGAELVQTIGHIVCLYRRHPESPKLMLPR